MTSVKLSKRLDKIAKMIMKDGVVFDVGSDHALLPCFLVAKGIAKKAYAGDIAKGPLEKAKATIKKYHLEDKVIPVLSDGLDEIGSDCNIITISGMGFYTVKHILEGKDLSSYKQIVVQVNKDVDKLRKFISDHNYEIIDEKIVYDDFYYVIVSFRAFGGQKLSEKEIKYGPIFLKRKDEEFKKYIDYQILKYQEIYQKSKASKHLKELDELKALKLLLDE